MSRHSQDQNRQESNCSRQCGAIPLSNPKWLFLWGIRSKPSLFLFSIESKHLMIFCVVINISFCENILSLPFYTSSEISASEIIVLTSFSKKSANFGARLVLVIFMLLRYITPGRPATLMSFAILTADQSDRVFPGLMPLLTASLFCEMKKY